MKELTFCRDHTELFHFAFALFASLVQQAQFLRASKAPLQCNWDTKMLQLESWRRSLVAESTLGVGSKAQGQELGQCCRPRPRGKGRGPTCRTGTCRRKGWGWTRFLWRNDAPPSSPVISQGQTPNMAMCHPEGNPPQSVPSWPLWSLLSSQAPGKSPAGSPRALPCLRIPTPCVCACAGHRSISSPLLLLSAVSPAQDPHSSGLEGSREPPAP